jgi:hypothetical protein
MIVRRPTPNTLAASVRDNPRLTRHRAKSAPLIGCCSSAIRRSVDAERSRGPQRVATGHETPSPSSTTSTAANASRSFISGARCRLRAINPVRSKWCSPRSPANRSRRIWSGPALTRDTLGTSSAIWCTFEILPTARSTPSGVALAQLGAKPLNFHRRHPVNSIRPERNRTTRSQRAASAVSWVTSTSVVLRSL